MLDLYGIFVLYLGVKRKGKNEFLFQSKDRLRNLSQ